MVAEITGTAWPAAPRSSSPPSTASRRPTRSTWPGSPTARSCAINAAWTAAHPSAGNASRFLHRRRRHAAVAVGPVADRGRLRQELPAQPLGGRQRHHRQGDHGPDIGLKRVYAGRERRGCFGVPTGTRGTPTSSASPQHGVVYTGGKAKIAEHGGDDLQDRNVPVLVSLPGEGAGHVFANPVATTQIAPSILALLGLNPNALDAVRIEHTRVLPGLFGFHR